MHSHSKRIEALDAIRGVAIIAMVVDHCLYDLDQIFGVPIPLLHTTFFEIFRQPFTWAFILLAGVSSRFSHSNWVRGFRVLACGLVLSVVTFIYTWFTHDNESIYFGILHFMGCAILLFALLRPAFEKIPPIAAFIIWSALFTVTFTMPDTYFVGIPPHFGFLLPKALTNTPNLYPIGIPDANFFSADYFPMIPWFFLFMAGTVIGKPIKEHKLPEKFYTAKVPFWAIAGRHTLLIYVVHQPIVYAALYLIFDVILKHHG
ncbi:MAG TPA: heparan-alpha-glucosaminide N-acetyltransferase [Clostridia bacterium]|nr:heparan-alpha-glucosaminide N-acetyltransferase [Clostridia bacterium]